VSSLVLGFGFFSVSCMLLALVFALQEVRDAIKANSFCVEEALDRLGRKLP
jgi:hypothetical protein